MKRLTAAVLALLMFAAAPAMSQELSRYTNARFGYSISYPAGLLRAMPEAENGDGRVFRARHGRAEARVWGAYNALEHTPAQIADEIAVDCLNRATAYRVVRHGMVAVSCLTVEGIIYQKTLIRGHRLMGFSMVYSAGERRTWDPVVARMAATMNLH